MKFNLNDFLQLDTKALLAVNGGTHCGGGSGSSGYVSHSGNNSYGSRGGGGSYGGSCSGSSSGGNCGGTNNSGSASSGVSVSTVSGGGNCSKFDLTPFIKGNNSDSDSASIGVFGAGICGGTTSPSVVSGAGICGGAASSTVASGGGVCGGSNNTNTSSSNNRPGYQTPDNPNDYHCDINSYNVAVNEGVHNPGNWNGNALSVNEIYNENYTNSSTDRPQAGTRGYGFYDNNGDGTYDHMYFYDYTKGGSSYHVWNSDGIQPVTESDWSINGTAVEHSVYVPLN